MNQDDIFDSLARNAFDFLQRSIADFDMSPKYSVIHFCAAVEMLLKARLMKEHWSLIVAKPEQASHAKFIAGDFASVTMDEARQRIRDIAGEDISDDAFSSFRALANHRNKMIHFFHAGVVGDSKAKTQIVAEQCRSWFHLHRLFDQWAPFFDDFRSDIRRADRAMKSHRKYLAAKFKALKTELGARRSAGHAPLRCSACGYKAAIPEPIDSAIAEARCLVCDHSEVQVEIDCPHCGKQVVLSNEGFAIFEQYYGSRSIHLFFNLWYRDFDYSPALDANGPQVDHIFPQSLLKTVKDINPESGKRNILHYRAEQRDQIANCMLLTADENGFTGKCDKPPAEWFAPSRFPSPEAHAQYLRLHLIPSDSSLWALDRYDDFVEARKALIKDKFSYMLQSVKGEAA